MTSHARAAIGLGLLLVVVSACEGSEPTTVPPPPPLPKYPAPVGSVVIDGGLGVAFVGESIQLKARVLSFVGIELTGRLVTWTVAGSATATISSNGLLNLYSAGEVTVTAVSEEQSGHVTIAAGYGDSLLFMHGGTVQYPGHATLTIEPFALPQTERVVLVPAAVPTPLSNVSGRTVLPGTFVLIYPRESPFTPQTRDGTLKLSYDPATLPAGFDQSKLVIMQFRGAVFTTIAPTSIDVGAHTVTTQVKGLFGYGVAY